MAADHAWRRWLCALSAASRPAQLAWRRSDTPASDGVGLAAAAAVAAAAAPLGPAICWPTAAATAAAGTATDSRCCGGAAAAAAAPLAPRPPHAPSVIAAAVAA